MRTPHNPFVWADLSTFDMHEAKRFYSACLGWRYRALTDDYMLCESTRQTAAGLYPMPEFFRKIKMPSFWMSYIQVDDIHETARLAEAHGAKIEVKPQPAPSGGMIALIRDPAGAGFTCYQGEGFTRSTTEHPGTPVWNELHISDLTKVEDFYTRVFGWTIRPSPDSGRYEIALPTGKPIAGITVTPNSIKGDKEYWGIYFAVPDLAAAQSRIQRAGGETVASQPLGTREAVLAYDSQGAAFYLLQANTPSDSALATRQHPPGIKWRAITGLVIVALAVVFNATWVWGLLFLLWVLPDLKTGSTHFLEHVPRRQNPVIYWSIMLTWIALSLYMFSKLFVSA